MLEIIILTVLAGLVLWIRFTQKAHHKKRERSAQLLALNSLRNKIRRDD